MSEVKTDGINERHVGVLNVFAAAILHNAPLVADGREGINGLLISNAMHISSWLNKEIKFPYDEDLYEEELFKRVAVLGHKTNTNAVFADTAGTYGS